MSHDLVLAASEVPWFYNLIFFPSWAMLHYSVLTVLILWVIWSTGKNWVTIIKVRYDHYHNKSCSSILGQIQSDWHALLELKEGCQANAVDVLPHVLLRWTLSYLSDIMKGTLFPPIFMHWLSIESRWDAEPTG